MVAGFQDMVTASQIAASIDGIRFDKAITGFEFKPSLGIVAKQIDTLGADIRSMREPLKRSIREVMIPSFATNFATGGRPTWDALSESTVKMRGSDRPILIRTGALAKVMSQQNIWSVTTTSATIRSLPAKVWYGTVQQGGHGGGSLAAGNWFAKYQNAAKKMLGGEASDHEVNAAAFNMFDKRLVTHGLAPADVTIPARPFAVFQEEDIDAIQIVFAEWLEARLQRVGLF
jgi:phage gpG-like protein